MAEGSRTSSSRIAERVPPVWLEWAMPSVADLFFLAILATMVFTPLSVRLLNDAGTGWHIRTGEQILAAHRIPRVDSFSSTMAGKSWFAWEWLYDLMVGSLDATCGLNGPVWLTAVVIAGTFAWLLRLLVMRGTGLFVAIALVLLAVSASTIHFLARPHVFSWLFALAWFWILDSTERDCFSRTTLGTRKIIWALPVLMVLWVNLHGGFVLGFILLAIFWFSALWTWWRSSASRLEESLAKIAAGKRAWKLTLVGLACSAASLVNPYGWKLHEHVWSYLSDRFLMDHIDEFQSPNFHGIAQRCFLLLLLISVATLAARGRECRASEILTVLFAIYAGLFASRNIPVSSILLTMIVGRTIPHFEWMRNFSLRMETIESRLRGHLWPAVAVLFTLVVAAHGGRLGSSQLMDAHFDPQRMPVEAVNFLSDAGIKTPILSTDSWGGYLIYRLYPEAQVVVDDRHDLYGSAFFKQYLKMIRIEDGWDAPLQKSDPSVILLPCNSALANMVGKTAGWKAIYADPVAIIFERARE